MSDVDLKALRAPFPADYVGKLPRITCTNCSRGNCGEHKKASCRECGNYISERHIHLDYVGHADVTSRLLDVDPEWQWAPQATDPDPETLKAAMASGDAEIVRAVIANAPPRFERDQNGNPVRLWMNLTVGGVTRPGVGSCPSNQADAEKVLIGDALRNAAMRFGVAVDLWAKGDRADPTAENPTGAAGQATRSSRAGSAGNAFDDATPSRPSGQRGQVSRPAAAQQPQSPSEGNAQEADEKAQEFAVEAHQARTLSDVEGIHKRAMDAGKVGAWIRNPASGGLGKLAIYIDWRRKQIKDVENALTELCDVGTARGMSMPEIEAHVEAVTGSDLASAAAGQLRQAAQALREKAAA